MSYVKQNIEQALNHGLLFEKNWLTFFTKKTIIIVTFYYSEKF